MVNSSRGEEKEARKILSYQVNEDGSMNALVEPIVGMATWRGKVNLTIKLQ